MLWQLESLLLFIFCALTLYGAVGSIRGHHSANEIALVDFSPSTRIVGGQNADSIDAPWMVVLLAWNGNSWIPTGCAGSLITNLHVLTAGHCALQHKKTGYTEGVYIGAYEPFSNRPSAPFDFSLVESYKVHESYSQRRNRNDVALITLKSPVDIQVFAPIRLATASFPVSDGDMLRIFGFGHTREGGVKLTDTLQVADLPYISSDECRSYYPPSAISPDMICAGFHGGGVDACQGDSGGAAIRPLNGVDYQVGIISWGVGCARAQRPGVFANVAFFHLWIKNFACLDPRVDTSVELCQEQHDLNPDLILATKSPVAPPTASPHLTVNVIPTPSTLPSTGTDDYQEDFIFTDECIINGSVCSDPLDCCSKICNGVCVLEAQHSAAPTAATKEKRKMGSKKMSSKGSED